VCYELNFFTSTVSIFILAPLVIYIKSVSFWMNIISYILALISNKKIWTHLTCAITINRYLCPTNNTLSVALITFLPCCTWIFCPKTELKTNCSRLFFMLQIQIYCWKDVSTTHTGNRKYYSLCCIKYFPTHKMLQNVCMTDGNQNWIRRLTVCESRNSKL
jgi:hypothetical protein